MYYAVEDNQVVSAKTLSLLNKKLNAVLDENEMIAVGADRIVYLTNADLDFIQDKRKLSTIMFGNFFKKDLLPRNLMIANLVFNFIILTRIMGMS